MICVIHGAKRYLSLISYLREGTSLQPLVQWNSWYIVLVCLNSKQLGKGKQEDATAVSKYHRLIKAVVLLR